MGPGMDGTKSVHLNGTSYKRRSSPPSSRSVSPGPLSAGMSLPNGKASSSAFSNRPPPTSRTPNGATTNGLYGGLSIGGPSYPSIMSEAESSTAVHATPGSGGYAYSTTLRRQASFSTETFPSYVQHRSVSPHTESPYRKRTVSIPYANEYPTSGRPLTEPVPDAGTLTGFVGRFMGYGRKLLGRQGYEEVQQDEEERRRSMERRQRETPSSIYAHRTVEVGLLLVA